jgi:Xaa-Pro aminopeptidase
MLEDRLDAVVVTAEAHLRYFTGYAPHLYVSPTRPWFAVLPLRTDPIGVIPELGIADMRRESWLATFRTWSSPCPTDEGVSELAATVNGIRRRYGRVGFELGRESRLGMPVGDFLHLRNLVDAEIVDATSSLQALRSQKSPAEIGMIREAADAAQHAFDAISAFCHIGLTERDLYREFQIAALKGGAERVPYVAIGSGSGGYDSLVRAPVARTLTSHDIVGIDAGTTVGGYWADFNRNFGVEAVHDGADQVYRRLWCAQERALELLHPGVRASEIWGAMQEVLNEGRRIKAIPVGRMGHGIGLDYTEPPSICASDHTVLELGMVVTIEPSVEFALPNSKEPGARIMALEEDVLIGQNGPELLTRRAPSELPIL